MPGDDEGQKRADDKPRGAQPAAKQERTNGAGAQDVNAAPGADATNGAAQSGRPDPAAGPADAAKPVDKKAPLATWAEKAALLKSDELIAKIKAKIAEQIKPGQLREDVFQTIEHEILRGDIPGYNVNERIAYCLGIANRQLKAFWRAERRDPLSRRVDLTDEEGGEIPVLAPDDVERDLRVAQANARVGEACDAMGHHGQVFREHAQEKARDEIAAATGLSPKTVSNLLAGEKFARLKKIVQDTLVVIGSAATIRYVWKGTIWRPENVSAPFGGASSPRSFAIVVALAIGGIGLFAIVARSARTTRRAVVMAFLTSVLFASYGLWREQDSLEKNLGGWGPFSMWNTLTESIVFRSVEAIVLVGCASLLMVRVWRRSGWKALVPLTLIAPFWMSVIEWTIAYYQRTSIPGGNEELWILAVTALVSYPLVLWTANSAAVASPAGGPPPAAAAGPPA